MGQREVATAKTPSLPASVRVGAMDYAVKPWGVQAANNSGAYGLCDAAKLAILIREDLPPMKAAEVLIHEVLHAAYDNAGLSYGRDGEERMVNALGYQMAQVWRDNPELVAYLEAVFGPTRRGWKQ